MVLFSTIFETINVWIKIKQHYYKKNNHILGRFSLQSKPETKKMFISNCLYSLQLNKHYVLKFNFNVKIF